MGKSNRTKGIKNRGSRSHRDKTKYHRKSMKKEFPYYKHCTECNDTFYGDGIDISEYWNLAPELVFVCSKKCKEQHIERTVENGDLFRRNLNYSINIDSTRRSMDST